MKQRLLVVNQVSGPLMCQLLEDMSNAGVECELLTGWADISPESKVPYKIAWAKRLDKTTAWKRIWSWGIFTLSSLVKLIRTDKPALITTNPPLVMLAAPFLKRLFGLRYGLLIYDIYPDVMERMDKIRSGGFISRFWRNRSRKSLLNAEGVITLGSHMADTLRGHLQREDNVNIDVIPNWADTDFIRPLPKSENPFARKHNLVDKLVVTYSGAFGKTHDIESIIRAAELLRDTPEVHFMLIGGGTREQEVEQMVREKKLDNLTLLDLQPWEDLPYSLAASDCCIVCLDEGYEGVSIPSKTYYTLAAGAALLAVTADNTELADLVRDYPCGTNIPPRSPEKLATTICSYFAEPDILKAHKYEARKLAEKKYSRQQSTKCYLDKLTQAFWLNAEQN